MAQLRQMAQNPADALLTLHAEDLAKLRPRFGARVFTKLGDIGAVWSFMEREPWVSVHQTQAWCAAWSRIPGIRTCAVLVTMDDKPAALFPLEITHLKGLRIARFIGAHHSNGNTGLFSADFLEQADADAVDGLIAAVKHANLAADIIVFDRNRPETGGAQHPFRFLPRVTDQNPSFQLPLFAHFEEVLAQINAKRRKRKFRISEKKLAAAGGYRHMIAGSDDEIRMLLESFFEQKKIRLENRGLPDVFSEPGVKDAITRLALQREASGKPVLELHAIMLGGENEGRIAAISGLTEKDGHVTCQFGSIDETIVPEASAGELLFYLMIERAAKSGCHVFDFGIGDQAYKRSWCPVETRHFDCFVPLTPLGSIVAPVLALKVSAKRIVKATPFLFAIATRLRALLLRLRGQP